MLTVYIDLFFIINTIIDFFLCIVTTRAMHLRTNVLRLLVSSLTGGLCGTARLFVSTPALYILLGFVTPALMLAVAFGKTRPAVFAGSYLVLFASSFAMGGIVFAAGELLQSGLPKKVLFTICFAAFFLCFFCFGDLSGTRQTEAVYISLVSDNNKHALRLLGDSGCLLREPISGLPVVLISSRVFDRIYGSNITDEQQVIRYKTRLVPIKTVTGNDIIPAVMPEKLEYTYKGVSYSCNAMIGRSCTDSFAGYDGIFPKTLL